MRRAPFIIPSNSAVHCVVFKIRSIHVMINETDIEKQQYRSGTYECIILRRLIVHIVRDLIFHLFSILINGYHGFRAVGVCCIQYAFQKILFRLYVHGPNSKFK